VKKPGTMWLALFFGLSLTACGGGGSGSNGGGGSPAADWTQVGQTLDGFVSTAVNPPAGMVKGYSFILFNRSGVLYTRAGGDHSVTTVDMLDSASKMPAAAAIMTLVDQNKLNLDTPIASYVQSAGNPITWPADKAAITMRMLLSHTSGLPGLADGQPACMHQQLLSTLKMCAQQIVNTALVSQPGAEFNYGGADYQVAGYIAVLLSGAADWQAFFNTALATPLGGIPSYTYGSALLVPNPRIAGGAMSNVSDYATILGMLLDGGFHGGTRVLSQEAITTLETDQIAGLPKAFIPFSGGAAASYPGYTLGLFISDASLYPGSPGPEFSDPGLSGATPWFDTGLGYGAVILINDTTQTGLDMWNAVRPLIIAQLTH